MSEKSPICSLENGKYELIMLPKGSFYALRNGEYWRDLTGDKMVYLMAQRISDQDCTIEDLRSQLKEHDALFLGFRNMMDKAARTVKP